MLSFCPDNSTDYYFHNQGLILKYPGPIFKKRTSVETLIANVEKEFPEITKYSISGDVFLVHGNFALSIVKNGCTFDSNGYMKDLGVLETIANIAKEAYDTETIDTNIMTFNFYLTPTGVCYDADYLTMNTLPSPLYVPYINTEVMFEQFFKSSENILLFTGKAGVGKSKLGALAVDYLSRHTDKVVANVATASDVNVLSSDSFWSDLTLEGIDLVVLDDLDFMLTPRSEEQGMNDVIKNRFISNFLAFTDGFKKNNVKFIITTNQSVDTIDTSLLRKGRMFDILELRELTNSEAKNVWNEYIKDEPFKLKGNVLACNLAHEIEMTKNSVEKRCYLSDKSVSKLENYSKTIGF